MKNDRHFLEQLSFQFPTADDAAAEIISLSSMLALPKGTEHFISDIHGEADLFLHILRNGSGSIRKKIAEELGGLSEQERRELAALIYYPAETLARPHTAAWRLNSVYHLVRVGRRISSKYPRETVRRHLPKKYASVIEELLTEREEVRDKEDYYRGILNAIGETGQADAFLAALAGLIRRLAVDRIHILGDIYDRGPGAHVILDALSALDNVDVQWGNHDICWLGAAAGSLVCAASVVRTSLKYGNFQTLESGYGLNLLPLARFALDAYAGDPCEHFAITGNRSYKPFDPDLDRKLHKAISVILFKLEGQLAMRRPEFGLSGRLILDKIDFSAGTVTIDGKKYPLSDRNLPTVDPADPYRLSPGEQEAMERLRNSFLCSEKLKRHADFLLSHGSMYAICNGNLLYHGCVPLTENGELRSVTLYGSELKGKALFDALDSWVRRSFYLPEGSERDYARDVAWFLWASEASPLYGKERMAVFERYFVDDPRALRERSNPYYRYLDDPATVNAILREFGLGEGGHIINGHVPVRLKKGERPVHCGGKLVMIDGGMAESYRSETGIAGYTLVSNSYGLRLVAHAPFLSREDAVSGEGKENPVSEVVEEYRRRLLVRDTDEGKRMQARIEDLYELLEAYRLGSVREKHR